MTFFTETTIAAHADIEQARRELAEQPRARKRLVEAFWAGALRDAVEESKSAESVEELRRWTEVSGSVLALLRHSDPDVLSRLLEALEQAEEEPDDAALEHWGRLQVQATLQRVRDASYTVAWLEGHGVSRQRLNQWRARGRLIGIPDVPGVKGFAYPRWQFTDGLRPKAWVAAVIEAATAARLDPLALHLFMTDDERGRSPAAIADAGDVATAVELVAAANAQGG